MNSRYWNGVPLLPRKPYRSTERCLITVILCTFLLVVCGTFYLPELRPAAATRQGLSRVYKTMQDAGPEFLIPAPPHAESLRERVKPFNRHFNLQSDDDPHVLDDAKKLRAKIDMAHKVLERPDVLLPMGSSTPPKPLAGPLPASSEGRPEGGRRNSSAVVAAAMGVRPPIVGGGEDADPSVRQKRDKVVEVRLPCCILYSVLLFK